MGFFKPGVLPTLIVADSDQTLEIKAEPDHSLEKFGSPRNRYGSLRQSKQCTRFKKNKFANLKFYFSFFMVASDPDS